MQRTNLNFSDDLEQWEAMLYGDRSAFANLYERYFALLFPNSEMLYNKALDPVADQNPGY